MIIRLISHSNSTIKNFKEPQTVQLFDFRNDLRMIVDDVKSELIINSEIQFELIMINEGVFKLSKKNFGYNIQNLKTGNMVLKSGTLLDVKSYLFKHMAVYTV